jgi:hypothetical protein
MLPFLKNHKQAGVIVSTRKPDEKDDQEPSDSSAAMEACAQDIIRAIEQKDSKHLALALQAAFECMESEPHEESPHTYEAQNIKAGE